MKSMPEKPDPPGLRAYIEARLEAEITDVASVAPELVELVRRYCRRAGKLIRPRLLIETARLYGHLPEGAGELRDLGPVKELAAAVELLHLVALVHDDRIDGLDRENRPIAGDHTAASLRVLAGDLVHSLALDMIGRTRSRHELPEEILSVVRNASVRTIAGQAQNMRFLADHGARPSLQALYELYDGKTGHYSFVVPLRLGLLASGPEASASSDHRILERLGLLLGRIFQLRDDVADIAELREAPGDAVPDWEFNLAATYVAETERGGSVLQEPREPGAGVVALDNMDLEALSTWTSMRIAAIREELEETARQLSLPEERGLALLHYALNLIG